MMTFPAANALYRRETYDNYPAARAIMSCVFEGLQLPFDLALRVESRCFAQDRALAGGRRHDALACSSPSRSSTKAPAGRRACRPRSSKKIGVLGVRAPRPEPALAAIDRAATTSALEAEIAPNRDAKLCAKETGELPVTPNETLLASIPTDHLLLRHAAICKHEL